MSKFVRILNWDRLQHYKDRNPPWIKLHRDLMTSETWVSSTNDDRVLMVAIMMLAAATGNRTPANPRYIQRIAYLENEPDLSGLVELKFIEIIEEVESASKPLASARPERETDTDLEKDSEANASGADAPKGPSAIDLKAAVFASGVPLLQSTGSTDRNARSMLGRWRSDHGDAAVLDALAAATAQAVSDPIPWIKTRLERSNGTGKLVSLRGSRPDPSLDFYNAGKAREQAESVGGGSEADWGAGASLPTVRAG
jgi:hypothetical protein